MGILSQAKKMMARSTPKASKGQDKEKSKVSDKKANAKAKAEKHDHEGHEHHEHTHAPVAGSIAERIGLTPIISEKSMTLQATSSTAIFQVRPSATKNDVAAAIFEQYKVKPISVRTVNTRGKARRRGRTYGSTAATKKAYVKVKDIQSLNLAP